MTEPDTLRFAQLARPALVDSRARTLVALLVLIGGITGLSAMVIIGAIVTGVGERLLADEGWLLGPVGLALSLLILPMIMLPSALLTARWILRMSPRQVCSVTGAFRWSWYWRCLPVAAVVVVASTLMSRLGTGASDARVPDEWLTLLVIIGCGVPIAAFAEEFVFRGVLTHILGARWSHPFIAVTVPGVVTSALFSLSHGPTGIALFSAYAGGGVAYAILCDRTGGLEASTAAHTAWNIALLVSISFFDADGGTGNASAVVLPMFLTELALVIVLAFFARRSRIAVIRPVEPTRHGQHQRQQSTAMPSPDTGSRTDPFR